MKCLIMAGGTGGHVYPALAVAAALREQGDQVVWMGSPDSFEARVVPVHGFPLEYVRVGGLRGKGLSRLLLAPLHLVRALAQALAVLRRQRPDVVLGMGGFASGPGGVATWLCRRPLVIHEQNAFAGLTNRLLARLASRVLQAFPQTFPRAHTVGNPVRAAVAALPPPEERLGGRSGPIRLLVIGGSQGARSLNEKVPEGLSRLPPTQRPQVRHQAGRTAEVAQSAYARHGVEARVETFIEDMAEAYAWADLVICRAGASTVAELAAAGCASVLVPFPFAVDDHQTRNAQYLVDAGAARLLAESQFTPERLAQLLDELADRGRLVTMASAARAAAWPAATAAIVRSLQEAGRR